MKKTILLITAFLIAVSAFTGCETADNQATNDIESYDNVSVYIPETSGDTDSGSRAPLTGEIVVKDVKYSGEMGDVAVITVENGTDKDYEITVNCNFLDKDGNVLKNESQTFEQFSSGYTNNFIFSPEIEFKTFTYTIDTTEAKGPFHAHHIETAFKGFELIPSIIWEEFEKGDYTKYPTVCGFYSHGYNGEESMVKVYSTWLLINEHNEVVWVDDHVEYADNGQVVREGWQAIEIYQTTDKDYKIPEKWQGEIKAIVSITNVTTETPPPPPPMTE